MKKNPMRILLVASSLALFGVGCAHGQGDQSRLNARDQYQQATGQIPESWQSQRDDYAKKVQNRLDDFNQRITDLKNASMNQNGDQKKSTDQLASNLQNRVNSVQNDLTQYKVATADNYSQRQVQLESDLAKAEDAYVETKTVATSR